MTIIASNENSQSSLRTQSTAGRSNDSGYFQAMLGLNEPTSSLALAMNSSIDGKESLPPAACENSNHISTSVSTETLVNDAPFQETPKRHRKNYPPPMTAKMLKLSKIKYYVPPEVFISDDDDDEVSDEAAKQRLLDIFQGRGRISRAETGKLSNKDNPLPSTSVALSREQLRIKRAVRKQNLLLKKANERKSQQGLFSYRIQPIRVAKTQEALPNGSSKKRKTEPQPSRRKLQPEATDDDDKTIFPRMKRRRNELASSTPNTAIENLQVPVANPSSVEIGDKSLSTLSTRVPVVQITDCRRHEQLRDSVQSDEPSTSNSVESKSNITETEPLFVKKRRCRTSLLVKRKVRPKRNVDNKSTKGIKPGGSKKITSILPVSDPGHGEAPPSAGTDSGLRRSRRRRVPRKFQDGWVYLGLTSCL